MKVTKVLKITAKGKTREECDQFFHQLKSFMDVEVSDCCIECEYVYWGEMFCCSIRKGKNEVEPTGVCPCFQTKS